MLLKLLIWHDLLEDKFSTMVTEISIISHLSREIMRTNWTMERDVLGLRAADGRQWGASWCSPWKQGTGFSIDCLGASSVTVTFSNFFDGLQISCSPLFQSDGHTYVWFYYGRLFKVELLCAIHYLKFVFICGFLTNFFVCLFVSPPFFLLLWRSGWVLQWNPHVQPTCWLQEYDGLLPLSV